MVIHLESGILEDLEEYGGRDCEAENQIEMTVFSLGFIRLLAMFKLLFLLLELVC